MAKLIYLHQSAEKRTADEKRAWFRDCAMAAWAKGCTHLRASVHPDDTDLTLVEGWDEQPESEGEPRWQLEASV